MAFIEFLAVFLYLGKGIFTHLFHIIRVSRQSVSRRSERFGNGLVAVFGNNFRIKSLIHSLASGLHPRNMNIRNTIRIQLRMLGQVYMQICRQLDTGTGIQHIVLDLLVSGLIVENIKAFLCLIDIDTVDRSGKGYDTSVGQRQIISRNVICAELPLKV